MNTADFRKKLHQKFSFDVKTMHQMKGKIYHFLEMVPFKKTRPFLLISKFLIIKGVPFGGMHT